MSDPYSILGISRDASDDEIKRAYRKLAKQYHPDVNKAPNAEAKFKEIQNAYQQVLDQKKFGNTGGSQGQGFQNGFGGFGGFGGFNAGYQGGQGSTNDMQAAVNYLNAGQYQAAYNILVNLQERDASWYYLFAIANYGMGNQIAAMDAAQTACEMDPTNQQYRQLYAQLQSGPSRYRNMQQPFGNMGNNFCCQILLCNMCCSALGSPMLCC